MDRTGNRVGVHRRDRRYLGSLHTRPKELAGGAISRRCVCFVSFQDISDPQQIIPCPSADGANLHTDRCTLGVANYLSLVVLNIS